MPLKYPALLDRSFFARSPLDVAPELLNKLVVVARAVGAPRAGRIVEVEAYLGQQDPASHAFRGITGRNSVMFGPAGYLYVYFSYGMHWCANVVCDADGTAGAVLLRALAPVAGLQEMRTARVAARADRHLCSGPGKLTQALGLTGQDNGVDLCADTSPVNMCSDGVDPPASPATATRIGISVGIDSPWRWFIATDPNVSRRLR